jgi:hypothetical protein
MFKGSHLAPSRIMPVLLLGAVATTKWVRQSFKNRRENRPISLTRQTPKYYHETFGAFAEYGYLGGGSSASFELQQTGAESHSDQSATEFCDFP